MNDACSDIDIYQYYIDVLEVFYPVLYRPLDRRVEAPKFMRSITSAGIQEIFTIYATAKQLLAAIQHK